MVFFYFISVFDFIECSCICYKLYDWKIHCTPENYESGNTYDCGGLALHQEIPVCRVNCCFPNFIYAAFVDIII